ncbi:MAG: YlxR family protein [Lachnospiraceae bacterium]|nr:YlxR family protein [Lachnospiraceae bacterium]
MSVKRKSPQRQCIGCGEMRDKRELIRILKTAEGDIILDATGKKNGRGAYLCFSRKCLERAVKGRGLERSFKMPVSAEVYENLRKELETVENGQSTAAFKPGDESRQTGER